MLFPRSKAREVVSRKCRIEALEDRHLLAVGTFTRLESSVSTNTHLQVNLIDFDDLTRVTLPFAEGFQDTLSEAEISAISDPPELVINHADGVVKGMLKARAEVSPSGDTPSGFQITRHRAYADILDENVVGWVRDTAETGLYGRYEFVPPSGGLPPGSSYLYSGSVHLIGNGYGFADGDFEDPVFAGLFAQPMTLGTAIYRESSLGESTLLAAFSVNAVAAVNQPLDTPDDTTGEWRVEGYVSNASGGYEIIDYVATGVNLLAHFSTHMVPGDKIIYGDTSHFPGANLGVPSGIKVGDASHESSFWASHFLHRPEGNAAFDFVEAINVWGSVDIISGQAPEPEGPFIGSSSPGDFNGDGLIDGKDAALWAEQLGQWAAGGKAPLIVTTENDVSNGNYSYGDLSLREAIALADSVHYPGPDTIVFAPSINHINLNSTLLVYGSSSNPVSIIGPGADKLTIDGHNAVSLIEVTYQTPATLRGLHLTNGFGSQFGAIKSGGLLTVDQCQIDFNRGYTVGGIWAVSGSISISNSTISNNGVTAYSAGGVYVQEAYPAIISNSTISSNSAHYGGGGVYATYTPVGIYNSTITQNSSNYGAGGGLRATNGYYFLHNTIVAQNTAPNGPDVFGGVAGGVNGTYNFIGYDPNMSNGINNGVNNNIVGGENSTEARNPLLGPLAYNGTQTVKTRAVLAGSSVIDKGDPGFGPGVFVFDERGAGFPRILDGDSVAGARVDIGAYEYNAASGAVATAALTVDSSDQTFENFDSDLKTQTALAALYPAAEGDSDRETFRRLRRRVRT